MYVSWVAGILRLYRDSEGRLPQDLEEVFRHPVPNGCGRDLGAKDLWKHPFVYTPDRDGQGFTLTSLGRDGRAGGSGPDKDTAIREEGQKGK